MHLSDTLPIIGSIMPWVETAPKQGLESAPKK
jgi:hypothetical protein